MLTFLGHLRPGRPWRVRPSVSLTICRRHPWRVRPSVSLTICRQKRRS